MRRFWDKLFVRRCQHARTVVATSVGVRRSRCDKCGHVSFRISPGRQPAPDSRKLRKAAGL